MEDNGSNIKQTNSTTTTSNSRTNKDISILVLLVFDTTVLYFEDIM